MNKFHHNFEKKIHKKNNDTSKYPIKVLKIIVQIS